MSYQFDWSIIWQYRDLLLSGLLNTLQLVLISAPLALMSGAFLALMRLSGFRAFRLLSASYVEVNRNIPVVVKLFFFYFVFGIPPIFAALLGLIIHQSAYIAEDIRAAIQSIPRGQSEAARASGLTSWLLIRQIIMPQATKIALPTLVIEMIELLKNSSIAMVITVEELTFASQQIESVTFRGFETATFVTLTYFVLAWLIARVGQRYRSRSTIVALGGTV
jgi:polar amino acid transport system permease protein